MRNKKNLLWFWLQLLWWKYRIKTIWNSSATIANSFFIYLFLFHTLVDCCSSCKLCFQEDAGGCWEICNVNFLTSFQHPLYEIQYLHPHLPVNIIIPLHIEGIFPKGEFIIPFDGVEKETAFLVLLLEESPFCGGTLGHVKHVNYVLLGVSPLATAFPRERMTLFWPHGSVAGAAMERPVEWESGWGRPLLSLSSTRVM